ncbi:MAG: glycosyltransferase family 39 protein [Gaiellaceae bacterium]
MLGEAESRELAADRSGGARQSGSGLTAALRAHPTAATAVALIGLVAVSAALRAILAREVHGPFVFPDELGYARMAQSLARTGHLGLFGKGGLAFSPLYPIALSPIYAVTSSAHTAYEWAHVVNAVLMSLAAFPVYGIARSVLDRPRALGVAALSLAAPLMFYTGLEMSENLAYPLALLAIWAMLRAVRAPRLVNDVLMLAAIALACAARLQLVALFPAAVTAILVVALIRPEEPEQGRLRSVGRAVSAHRLVFASVAIALVAVLLRTVQNGGALPLAGRYSNVGSAHANPLRVLEIAFHHLAELDLALGVVPFVGTLIAAYALARFGFPRRALVFGAVAAATTVWLVLEVAFDAAAFDDGSPTARTTQLAVNLPRIHERYMIYVVPLFLVALVAALRAVRPRVPVRAILGAVLVAALLPAAIPFHDVINSSAAVASFGLEGFTTVAHGALTAVSHATLAAVIAASVLAFASLYAFLRPRPSFAIVLTLLAFFVLSSLVRPRLIASANGFTAPQPVQRDWVDRVVGSGSVTLIRGPGATQLALLDTAAANESIARVYYTCRSAFGAEFNEQQLAAGSAIRTHYAVVPAAMRVSGRILARDRAGHLVLVAPTGGAVRIPSNLRCRS